MGNDTHAQGARARREPIACARTVEPRAWQLPKWRPPGHVPRASVHVQLVFSVVGREGRWLDLAPDHGLVRSQRAPGEELTYVIRVRNIDGEALILDHSYFRTASVPGITVEVARRSIYDHIEGHLGITIAMSKRTITVERATEQDNELLDLDGIDCLAVITSQTFDAQGILIERTQSRHRPDHFCFRDTAVRHHV